MVDYSHEYIADLSNKKGYQKYTLPRKLDPF